MRNVLLEGTHVDIGFIEETDLDLYCKFNQSTSFNGKFWPLTIVNSRVNIERKFRENGFFSDTYSELMILNKEEMPVGLIYFYTPFIYFNGLEIGVRIFQEKDMGKGYGTEAMKLIISFLFRRYNVDRIQATCHVGNLPSIRMIEKAGMQFEGCLRKVSMRNGRFLDCNIYSIVRSEIK
jgi:RimJ/RimL family protein N-acetyltransferase